MIKNLIYAFITVMMAFGLTVALDRYFKTSLGDFFILEQGQKLPDFTFQTMNGKNHNYYDYTEGQTIIHFWATWCAPCVVEFPDLVAYARNHPNSSILAISSDRNQNAIKRFLEKYTDDLPDNMLIIHDRDNDITKGKFSVFALPESFIAKENAILESHIIGAYTGWADE